MRSIDELMSVYRDACAEANEWLTDPGLTGAAAVRNAVLDDLIAEAQNWGDGDEEYFPPHKLPEYPASQFAGWLRAKKDQP